MKLNICWSLIFSNVIIGNFWTCRWPICYVRNWVNSSLIYKEKGSSLNLSFKYIQQPKLMFYFDFKRRSSKELKTTYLILERRTDVD